MSVAGNGPVKRFAVDVMLGGLAKWLRVLGFDTRATNLSERARIEEAVSEGLVPVTRREKFREMEGVLFIGSDHHFEQLKEVISRLRLDREDFGIFTRCTICNARLDPITREAAFGGVPDYVYETATDFRKCPECGRIYWPGSHKGRMLAKLASITEWDPREEEAMNGRE
ncbi:MAG: Mut7-C RNAse domain-containing protein [Syntrophobacteraceae bacterium]